MIGQTFPKPCVEQEDLNRYSEAASWCNSNNAAIEDKGEYYEVVPVVVPEPTVEEIKQKLINAVQAWLDEEARSYGYDSIDSTAKYLFCDQPKFKNEAIGFSRWAGAVWDKCYELLDLYEKGQFGIPEANSLIEMLPKLIIEDSE